ncbi:MAG: non-homologous end-joining DNA ligase [Gammaproteobacteria bacterium]|nr:non-homologous end-joining DNA ligase [Gammaproteobacteria bacterium]
MSRGFDSLDPSLRSRLEPGRKARFLEPMRATLTHDHFSDPDWLFERKLDGERLIVVRRRGHVDLYTRNGNEVGDTYPELREAMAGGGPQLVADGEAVAFEGKRTSFARLQQRMKLSSAREARRSPVAVYLYLFDLLHLDGHDLQALPLRARKGLLREAVAFAGRVRYTPHRNEAGEAYHATACEKGWEGVIAKRADAPYRHARTRDWLKFKCVNGQELVIGGFTEPRGERHGLGALLVGYYDDEGQLHYAGKVGTGYDEEELERLRRLLDRRARQTSPFTDPVRERGAHFVRPELVAEFGFTEWTRDGKLRHPRYLGLRRDKDPRDVVREDR